MLEKRIQLALAMASQFGNGGGVVIDAINNCGWLAGEQVIFSSPYDAIDFIKQYFPILIYESSYKDFDVVVIRSSFGAYCSRNNNYLTLCDENDYGNQISSMHFG